MAYAESYNLNLDVDYVLVEHARRKLMKRELSVVVDDSVACVGTALKADHHIWTTTNLILGHLIYQILCIVIL